MSQSSSPNLNGTVERANRPIVESARSMLEYSGLSKRFWEEARDTEQVSLSER